MPDRDGNPYRREEFESAIRATNDLIHEVTSLADYYWTGDGVSKLDRITNCLSDTPAMDRAAAEVGQAYRKLADALTGYRSAAKRALDQELNP